MASQLTVRGVSEELNRRLTALSRESGQSVNSLAVEILEKAVGITAKRERLDRYMTWTQADFAEFEASLKAQRGIDHDLWD